MTAAYIFTTPNPWKARTTELRDLIPSLEATVVRDADTDRVTVTFGSPGGKPSLEARRPLSGLSLKEHTTAFVTVLRADGQVLTVFNDLGATQSPTGPLKANEDPSAPRSRFWTDWSLISVQESRQEKVQIVETFGDPVVYMFGERPRFLQFRGYLVNSADNNWRAQFWENWDRFFRGTRLVEQNAKMFITFDDILVGGYPLNASASQSANDPHLITFEFSFIVTEYSNLYMQNVGSVQRLQRLAGGGSNQYQVKLGTTFVGGAFQNTSYELGAAIDGPLAQAIGGERLQALQVMEELRDTLRLGPVNTYDLLFDPRLRYIKGQKTAIDVLLAYQRQTLNTLAYQGVEEAAKNTKGGLRTLNYWFGLVGHLYTVVAVNGIRALGGRGAESESRWVDMLDLLPQLGSPYALASYLGYTADFLVGGALYSLTDKFELSNQEFSFSNGLSRKTQDPKYGIALSQRAVQSTTQERGGSGGSGSLRTGSASGINPGYAEPLVPADEIADAESVGVRGAQTRRASEEQVLLEDAVREQRRGPQRRNLGAATALEDTSAIEDDGT